MPNLIDAQGCIVNLQLDAPSSVPQIRPKPADCMNRAAPCGQQTLAQLGADGAEGNRIKDGAVAALQSQPKMGFSNYVDKPDPRVGHNNDGFGISRTKWSSLREFVNQRGVRACR
jgi:hypothetical protein